jgi:hypothetical protein
VSTSENDRTEVNLVVDALAVLVVAVSEASVIKTGTEGLTNGNRNDSVGTVVKAEQFDMPFVNDLPKREKSRWVRVMESFQEAKKITDEKGMLVPVALAAKIGGVSKQRIDQLCDAGALERVYLDGHPFIPENSLLAWAQSERKSGRPFKDPTLREMVTISADVAKESRRRK